MNKIPLLIIFALFVCGRLAAQDIDQIINRTAVEKIERVLSADDMQGRATFSPGIERAADFIEAQFRAAGLQTWNGGSSYRQPFSLIGGKIVPANPDSPRLLLANVVGILPGRSKKNEYVIFSAHYDHLGIGQPDIHGDSIYNGANDDASGTTAVIMLARYFSKRHDNERTLVFAAFTAEEIGEYGSQYFSRQFDPATVVAMFNIEMIGTESKWGRNSAFITGYERTNMGEILKKNLIGSPFTFYPDPYPQEGLFYRSDNASLARQGVPAHTISTSKMDSEKYYHTQGDEIGTLDMSNMAHIIRSIALSSRSIVRGLDKPSRVDIAELK
jgi:Zn-dependent M28 family amino/carboxypeptidase